MQWNDSHREMNYKTRSITKKHKSATVLVAIAALAGVLVIASTVESEHLAFAYKGFSRGVVHMKGDNGKHAIEQSTNIDQKTICETAGGNSPIDASCTNTAITHSINTGGIGGVRGGTGDDGAIEQPTNIDQKTICETAGGNSPIDASCTNTAITHSTNTGGIGGVPGGTGDDGAIEQPTNIDQKTECLTAGGNSGIQGSCMNAGGTTTSNTGGITSTSNTGGITGSIKLPFGGFP